MLALQCVTRPRRPAVVISPDRGILDSAVFQVNASGRIITPMPCLWINPDAATPSYGVAGQMASAAFKINEWNMSALPVLALSIILSLAGCVEVPPLEQWPRTSTRGVRQIGQDTYFVEIIRGSDAPSDARMAALHHARSTCAKQDKVEFIVDESHTINYNSIELTFRCLDYDDPLIRRLYFDEKGGGKQRQL